VAEEELLCDGSRQVTRVLGDRREERS
jgi:hypothetical protein